MTSAAARVCFEGKLLLAAVVPLKLPIRDAQTSSAALARDRWDTYEGARFRREALKVRAEFG
jgi:hypothetical protein